MESSWLCTSSDANRWAARTSLSWAAGGRTPGAPRSVAGRVVGREREVSAPVSPGEQPAAVEVEGVAEGWCGRCALPGRPAAACRAARVHRAQPADAATHDGDAGEAVVVARIHHQRHLETQRRRTLGAAESQVPLVVDVRDDSRHHLRRHREPPHQPPGYGRLRPARYARVPDERPDRAILTHTLDLNRRGLLPGDTVRYFAVATDNTPQRQSGRSPGVRAPPAHDERGAGGAAGRFGRRAQPARLASRREAVGWSGRPRTSPASAPAAARPGERNEESLSFERSKRAEAVAKGQQELFKQAEELKQSLEALRKSAEAAGVGDSAWQRQLQEIREQLDRALSPELRERLAALQRALKDLDAEQAKEALERLAEAQRRCARRWSGAGSCSAAPRSRAISPTSPRSRGSCRGSSGEWNEQVQRADSARAAAAERELAARADSLAKGLERLAKQMERRQQQRWSPPRSRRSRRPADEQASKSAQQGQRDPAQEQGEQAAESLEPLGDQLQREREAMQQQWRQEVMQAIDQALAETGRLAERQLAVQEALRNGAEPRRPSAPSRARSRKACSGCWSRCARRRARTRSSPPQIGAALGGAQVQMQKTREAIASAVPNVREGAEQAGGAVDALNAAAHQLLRARGDVSGSASGSGLAEAMERMAEMAKQQGGLGQQAAGMLPMMGSAGIQQELRRLGNQQRALAEELAADAGAGQPARRGRAGRRGQRAGPAAGRRQAGPAGGRTAGAALPPHARRRPHAAGSGGGRAEGAPEHRRDRRQRPAPPGAAGAAHRRRRPAAGARAGTSCSGCHRRSAGWWWTTSGGSPRRPRGSHAVRSSVGALGLASGASSLPRACSRSSGTMPRAFELERRGNYAAAAERTASCSRRNPGDVSAPARARAGAPPAQPQRRDPARRQRRLTANPSSAALYGVALRAWAAADQPDSMRAVAERWARIAPATKRRTGSGARPRSPPDARPRARRIASAGERLGRDDVLAAEMAQLAMADGDYATAAREWLPAVRRLPGYRITAVATLGHTPAGKRPEVLRILAGGARLHGAAARVRAAGPLGRSARRTRALEAGLPRAAGAGGGRAARADRQLRTQRTRDGLLAQGRALEAIAAREPRAAGLPHPAGGRAGLLRRGRP